MKHILLFITCIFLMACTSPREVVYEAPASQINMTKKNTISTHFFEDASIKSISVATENLYSVNEWFNEDTIIYSVGNNGVTSLYLHNIYSGERTLFYQTENLMINIKANSDYSKFALHTVESSGKADLTILDREGKLVYNWSALAEEIQYRWNPYKSNELMLTSFLPFLQFEVLSIDVNTGQTSPVSVKNPFVQWISKDEIGYLNWNQNEPSIDAPLHIVNLNTLNERKWIEHCIMFFSMPNTVVTVSVDENRLDHSLYSFYEGTTGKKIKHIYIPILNTFSEAWWLPSYDFDSNKKVFYYMEPKRPADINEYKEGYNLKAVSLADDEVSVLATVPHNVPIKLSPNGDLLLVGQQFEQIIHIPSKQIFNLVQ